MSVRVRWVGVFGARESKIKVTLRASGIRLSAHRFRWRERMRFPPTSAQAADLLGTRSLGRQPEHSASQ